MYHTVSLYCLASVHFQKALSKLRESFELYIFSTTHLISPHGLEIRVVEEAQKLRLLALLLDKIHDIGLGIRNPNCL